MKLTNLIVRRLWESSLALHRNREGQDLIEYALMAGFIVVSVLTMAPQIADSFVTVMSKVNSVAISAGAS
jgi:Flp pilus assembly pilin Flp